MYLVNDLKINLWMDVEQNWHKQDLNLRRCKSTGLQPVAIDHSAIVP